jgi:DNA-binding PadR family transcriptional regulator
MLKSQIKFMVIRALEKESLSGYGLMKLLKEQTGKKPSPGYMYPLLHDLEKEKFISVKEDKRKKVYSLNAKGKNFLGDLMKRHRQSMDAMFKAFEPLGDKKEIEKFYAMHTKMLTFKDQMMQDMDIFTKLQNEIFNVYKKNDPLKRKQLRKVIQKATKELENISKK